MSDSDPNDFRQKLDEFSRRLQAHINAFRQKGEFVETHRSLLNQIQQRHDRLADKVSEAERNGTRWKMIEAEVARDYNAMFDQLEQAEERLDSETMREPKT